MTSASGIVFGESDGGQRRIGNAAILMVAADAAADAATAVADAAVEEVGVAAGRRLRTRERRGPAMTSTTATTTASSSSVHAIVEIAIRSGRSFRLRGNEAGSLGNGGKLGRL